MRQTSRGKFNRLQRTTAEFTTSTLDGYGLRDHLPARPAPYASYPVLVHRLASLLHAAFRPRLATMPWRFAIASPPSGCEGDLHPKAVKHARHTKNGPRSNGGQIALVLSCSRAFLAAIRRGGRRYGRSLGGGLAALRPLRACRRNRAIGGRGSLGRQTVFHQPNMHAACPDRLGGFIAG